MAFPSQLIFVCARHIISLRARSLETVPRVIFDKVLFIYLYVNLCICFIFYEETYGIAYNLINCFFI